MHFKNINLVRILALEVKIEEEDVTLDYFAKIEMLSPENDWKTHVAENHLKRKEEKEDDYKVNLQKSNTKKKSRIRKTSKNRKESKIVQSDTDFRCKKCFIECKTRTELVSHGKIHQEEKLNKFRYNALMNMYVCTICSEDFSTKEDVLSHTKKDHVERFVCSICDEIIDSVYYFAIHMKSHSDTDSYFCPLCKYSCLKRDNLRCHIARVHYQSFYYYCNQCGKGFMDNALFKEHTNKHLGIESFTCVVCNKLFGYSRNLIAHQIKCHTVNIEGFSDKSQCNICLKLFCRSEYLSRHMKTVHNPNEDPNIKKHLCDVCGQGFRQSDKLQIHYRTHTGIKPYSCGYCQKSFIKKSYLIMHERIHTGEKPYNCEFCKRGFNQRTSLIIHIRRHTGERPYTCQFCNTGHISQSSLNTHKKVCTGIID